MFQRLLAKSIPQNVEKGSPLRQAARYTAHIEAVMKSADVLLDRIGQKIHTQLQIKTEYEHFVKTVKLGAYLHDWGKANQHFQEMVYLKSLSAQSDDPSDIKSRKQLQKEQNKHDKQQMLRHELLSVILALKVPSFRAWLEQCNADLIVAVWGAMGHHLKAKKDFTEMASGTGSSLRIFTQHDDFQAVLLMGVRYLGLPRVLPEAGPENWQTEQLEKALISLKTEFFEFSQSLSSEKQKLIAAVKATVISADLAGSALPVAGCEIEDWIHQTLSLVLEPGEIEKLLDKRLEGKPLRGFQQQMAAASQRVTLVKAGCGTGKTAGAYGWAKEWARDRKLFFCYPTMGTAFQGYLDYAAANEFETELMHSHADIDLEGFLATSESKENPKSTKEQEEKREEEADTELRLAAFAAWQAKLIVCTVDTVLGLVQNNRKPLYSFPAIILGAFVFDEVHAYDAKLFAALLVFIKTFRGAPILLMSASFSPTQLRAIEAAVKDCGETVEIIEGYRELEVLPRYQFCDLPEATEETEEIWETAIRALEAGGKVLWVTNSVQSCIDIYRQAEGKFRENLPQLSPQRLIYHSRFRYRDRQQKHDAVIAAFKSNDPVFAVTTQVCEMSLDISADLLVSAMAPAAALIQRLGRLNRFVVEGERGKISLQSGRIATAVIYGGTPQKSPYSNAELETGKALVQRLKDCTAISQHDLAEIASTLDTTASKRISPIWLEGDWETTIEPLREGGYTVTVLLEEDLAEIKKISGGKWFMKEAKKWAVSIRIPPNFSSWQRIKFYRIAPREGVQYSSETGAES